MVTTRPLGTCFINASTSRGAGMTNVPVPHRLVNLPVTLQTLGKPLLSASFSRQDFFVFITFRWWRDSLRADVESTDGSSGRVPLNQLKMRHDFNLHIRAFRQRGDLDRSNAPGNRW